METFAVKDTVCESLASAYAVRDDLQRLGLSMAARDPISIAWDFAKRANDSCIAALESLQNSLPTERN